LRKKEKREWSILLPPKLPHFQTINKKIRYYRYQT
jgi:hypothetical protein